MTNEVAFIFFYGVVFGVAIGFAYFIPMICGWEFFPTRRGMVSGVTLGGFGFGSFVFGFIAMALANPHNASTHKVANGDSMFDWEVA